MLVAVLLVAFAACDEAPRSPSPRPPPSAIAPLDLNAATVKQLEMLPEIGPKLARSIIASRNARGGRFERIEDLLAIDGIGEKTLAAIRPYLVLGPGR